MEKRKLKIVSFWLPLVLAACSQQPDNFIVKIGEAVLTDEMLAEAIPEEQRRLDSRSTYIQKWVESELLQRAAHEEGLQQLKSFRQELGNFRRALLAQYYIDHYLARTLRLTPIDIEEYYNDHGDQFKTNRDEIKVEYFITESLQKARAVKAKFARMSRIGKRDFLEVIAEWQDSLDVVGSTGYVSRDDFEPTIARKLFGRNTVDDVIGPLVNKKGQYTFWHVVDLRYEGTLRNLDEVAHKIEARLHANRRQEKIADSDQPSSSAHLWSRLRSTGPDSMVPATSAHGRPIHWIRRSG